MSQKKSGYTAPVLAACVCGKCRAMCSHRQGQVRFIPTVTDRVHELHQEMHNYIKSHNTYVHSTPSQAVIPLYGSHVQGSNSSLTDSYTVIALKWLLPENSHATFHFIAYDFTSLTQGKRLFPSTLKGQLVLTYLTHNCQLQLCSRTHQYHSGQELGLEHARGRQGLYQQNCIANTYMTIIMCISYCVHPSCILYIQYVCTCQACAASVGQLTCRL